MVCGLAPSALVFEVHSNSKHIRTAVFPETAFWHDLGLSGRDSHVVSRFRSHRNSTLARFRIVRTQ
eukprot:3233352-Pyramimonas_sp.AAC.1